MKDMGEKHRTSLAQLTLLAVNHKPWWQQEEQAPKQALAGSGSGAWDGQRVNFNGMDHKEFTTIYESMPSGTVYVGPDGKRRVRK